ncbi:hypothetical protein AZE41_12075 [Sporosarcina psychrophila]|nr:hypothetical protein AZE41_12075 [Sporosarcina psychrophila]
MTYDHFIPFSKGGSFEQDNILPCCSGCNSSKNNSDFERWYEKQDFFNEDKALLVIGFINEKKKAKALD